jgi:hypothetical protein
MQLNFLKYLFVIITICIGLNADAQKDDPKPFYEHHHELGINASQLLANVLSLNTNVNATTPFGFHYAYHGSNYTFRFSTSAYYNKKVDLFSKRRELLDHVFTGKIALERHVRIMPKLNFQYGLDALVKNEHTESIVGQQFFTSDNTLSVGGGPAIRLVFKINPKINLMTESTFYGVYGFKENRVQDGIAVPEIKRGNESNVILNMPTSLFIQILF